MKSNSAQTLSRRDFLKLGGTTLGGLFLRPLGALIPPQENWTLIGYGRVTVEFIYVYEKPSFHSARIGKCFRDELLWLDEEILSPEGPAHNPRWYHISQGYVYSAYLQRVENRHSNLPLDSLPPEGMFGEVTAPYERTYRYTRAEGWQPLYRLYYESVHHLTAIEEGPQGMCCYRIHDHRLDLDYHVPAIGIRPIPFEEYSPTSTSLGREEKRIKISIGTQTLQAFEGDKLVLESNVASGIRTREDSPSVLPTDTPLGVFRIQVKTPSRHMGNGSLTSEIGAYELPGVPWTMIFHREGYALHGTYWHNNFGLRMSHGCVNLPNAVARWLFRWTEPYYSLDVDPARGVGTLVEISE